MHAVQPQINRLCRHIGGHLFDVTSGHVATSGRVQMADLARVQVVVVRSFEVVGGGTTAQTQDGGDQKTDSECDEVRTDHGPRQLGDGEPPLTVLRRRPHTHVHLGDRVVVDDVVERLDTVHLSTVTHVQ